MTDLDIMTDLEKTIHARLRTILGKLPSGAMRNHTPDQVLALNDTFGAIAEAAIVEDKNHPIGRNARLILEGDYELSFCWDGTRGVLVASLDICPIYHIEDYEE